MAWRPRPQPPARATAGRPASDEPARQPSSNLLFPRIVSRAVAIPAAHLRLDGIGVERSATCAGAGQRHAADGNVVAAQWASVDIVDEIVGRERLLRHHSLIPIGITKRLNLEMPAALHLDPRSPRLAVQLLTGRHHHDPEQLAMDHHAAALVHYERRFVIEHQCDRTLVAGDDQDCPISDQLRRAMRIYLYSVAGLHSLIPIGITKPSLALVRLGDYLCVDEPHQPDLLSHRPRLFVEVVREPLHLVAPHSDERNIACRTHALLDAPLAGTFGAVDLVVFPDPGVQFHLPDCFRRGVFSIQMKLVALTAIQLLNVVRVERDGAACEAFDGPTGGRVENLVRHSLISIGITMPLGSTPIRKYRSFSFGSSRNSISIIPSLPATHSSACFSANEGSSSSSLSLSISTRLSHSNIDLRKPRIARWTIIGSPCRGTRCRALRLQHALTGQTS